MDKSSTPAHRVVIIGSGFGGLFAANALKKDDCEITLISNNTSHVFQPLLYQVATGILSEGLIAPSTREVLAHNTNTTTVFGHVTDIDVDKRVLKTDVLDSCQSYEYDSLIVAAGAGQSYFGNDHFAKHAPGMKTIDDALELRGRIFGAFELAEIAALEGRSEDVATLMTFIVVGAGPTGVEMAGQIAELSHRTLKHDFRHINTKQARIILVDAADRVLPPFAPKLGKAAEEKLNKMGVETLLGAMVTEVDGTGITVSFSDGEQQRIDSLCKVWAAGVQASPLAAQLAKKTGAEIDRSGRVEVDEYLNLPGHPEIFVIGDMANRDGLPGVAQVAIQGGRYAAATIRRRLAGRPAMSAFRYNDKGSMATISRFSAVAQIGKREFTGFFAWVIWLAVHLLYIIGFKSRLTTMLHWMVAFFGRGRGERTATEQQIYGRVAIQRWGEEFTPTVSVPGMKSSGRIGKKPARKTGN